MSSICRSISPRYLPPSISTKDCLARRCALGSLSRRPEWMRCAEMAYASSVSNAHSSQGPTVKKSDKWLKRTKRCVLAGVAYRASAALGRAAGETFRGSIPGQPPQKLPPNDCQVRRLSAVECLAALGNGDPVSISCHKTRQKSRPGSLSVQPSRRRLRPHLLGTAVALPPGQEGEARRSASSEE